MTEVVGHFCRENLSRLHLDVHNIQGNFRPRGDGFFTDPHLDFLHERPHIGALVVHLVIMANLYDTFHQGNGHHEGQTVIGALPRLRLPVRFS